MTDTPRTDNAAMAWKNHQDGRGCSMWRTPHGGVVFADFARELERELAQRTAERNALAAEVAAIKAHDPLAEMWRELAEYQPQADRDGHGESWRIMCEERTEEAAGRAWWASQRVFARDEARVAAARACAAASTHSATDAIAAIRRAKEAR
jgi:chorismate mutase